MKNTFGNISLNKVPRRVLDELQNPPQAGTGIHSWIFTMALKLHHHLKPDAVEAILLAAVKSCDREVPDSEVHDAVVNAKGPRGGDGKSQKGSIRISVKRQKWPDLNETLRSQIIKAEPFSVSELRDQSSVTTGHSHQDSDYYVDRLFPGNPLLSIASTPACCLTMERTEWSRRYKLAAHDLIVPSPMSAMRGSRKDGETSNRCLDNTGPRRFLITEFDGGSLAEQAGLIWHLKQFAPLVLVLWSGSKSLHAWWNADGVEEATLRKFFHYAVSLGADPATWTCCQLVRLPEGWRQDKGARQSVYYFDPGGLPEGAGALTGKEVSK